MRVLSIDIETTGTKTEKGHQIIEVGAVIENMKDSQPIEELPRFHCFVDHENYTVSPYVLGMHVDSGIWKNIQTRDEDLYKFVDPGEVGFYLKDFLIQNGFEKYKDKEYVRLTAAGKNVAGFDIPFMKKTLPGFGDHIRFSRRCLDPGQFYYRPDEDDDIPDSKTCMERAGLEGEVAHTAVDDAIMVVKLLRNYYKK